MRWFFPFPLLALGMLGNACGEGTPGGSQPAPSPAPYVALEDNGQTGALARGPCTAESCEVTAQRWLQSLDPARAFVPTFVDSSCRPADLGPQSADTLGEIHCRCEMADGRAVLVEATDAIPPHGGFCSVRGRGGFCIVWRSEFPTCQPNVPSSCQATCDLIEQRYAEDASKAIDADVRFAQCAQFSPTGEDAKWGDDANAPGDCSMVAVIDGQCYTNDGYGGFFSSTPHDCAEADRDIVLASARATASPPDPTPESGGNGAGWIWNDACPSSIDELCANGGLDGAPCVRDWSTASNPASWCTDPNIDEVAIWAPCNGHRVASIYGSTPSFGGDWLFLSYYYDETTGELLHVESTGAPSASTCVAGVPGSHYDFFGCDQPTFTTCR